MIQVCEDLEFQIDRQSSLSTEQVSSFDCTKSEQARLEQVKEGKTSASQKPSPARGLLGALGSVPAARSGEPPSMAPQAPPPPGPPPPPSKHVKTCALCVQPVKGSKFRLCRDHQRTYDVICKQKEILQKMGEESEKYVAYKKLWVNADSTLKDKVLLHFHRVCPSDVGGKKRKDFDWHHHYSHSFHMQVADDDLEADMKLDYTMFVTEMERRRKWTQAESDERWNALKASPDVKRDHGGLDGSLRLYVPSSITGSGSVVKRKTKMEEKVLQESKQLKVASGDDVASLRGEIERGFLHESGERGRLHEPLPLGAITSKSVYPPQILPQANAACSGCQMQYFLAAPTLRGNHSPCPAQANSS